jgi:hypothetical protein
LKARDGRLLGDSQAGEEQRFGTVVGDCFPPPPSCYGDDSQDKSTYTKVVWTTNTS